MKYVRTARTLVTSEMTVLLNNCLSIATYITKSANSKFKIYPCSSGLGRAVSIPPRNRRSRHAEPPKETDFFRKALSVFLFSTPTSAQNHCKSYTEKLIFVPLIQLNISTPYHPYTGIPTYEAPQKKKEYLIPASEKR